MAGIAPTITDVSQKGDGSTLLAVWTPVTSAGSDTCNPISYPQFTDKSVHVSGTFGGGSVAIKGSNNAGASYAALNDPSSTAIAITQETIKAILENTVLVQPVISGGTSMSVTISMLLRLNNPLRT